MQHSSTATPETRTSAYPNEEENLQALLDSEKENGLVDVKYFTSPDQDKDPDEFFTSARTMMAKHLRGESTLATDI